MAHSTQPFAATPAHPALHRHTEMFVWFVLSCHEFAGHGVHWLMLCLSANVPGGHGKHGEDRFACEYDPGRQTQSSALLDPCAAMPFVAGHVFCLPYRYQ